MATKKGSNAKDVAAELATRTGMSKVRSVEILGELFGVESGIITKLLKKTGKVTFTGFGAFKTAKRAARTARNPLTGESVKVSARTVARFTAGKSLKDAVN